MGISRFKAFLHLVTAVLGTGMTSFVQAQNFSYDGNRWYEIEVSIFANAPLPGGDSEITLPERTHPEYQEPLLKLEPASSAFSIPFASDQASSQENFGAINSNTALQAPIVIGPKYSPAIRDSFQLTDLQREPFIALGPAQHGFQDINQDLERSPEHRLLFHAVWRQPVLNKVQASAILVQGGAQFNEHHELEGSLLISYNINRVDVDADLWLTQFQAARENAVSAWQLPALPALVNGDSSANDPEEPVRSTGVNRTNRGLFGRAGNTAEQAGSQIYLPVHIGHLQESRGMRSNEFHYLDHPELGMIIQVRPYQLPSKVDFNLD